MRGTKNRIDTTSSGTDSTLTNELNGGGYGGNGKGGAWIKAAAPPRMNSFFSRSLSLLMSYVNAYTVTHFAFHSEVPLQWWHHAGHMKSTGVG